jgi:hypothetical protein
MASLLRASAPVLAALATLAAALESAALFAADRDGTPPDALIPRRWASRSPRVAAW